MFQVKVAEKMSICFVFHNPPPQITPFKRLHMARAERGLSRRSFELQHLTYSTSQQFLASSVARQLSPPAHWQCPFPEPNNPLTLGQDKPSGPIKHNSPQNILLPCIHFHIVSNTQTTLLQLPTSRVPCSYIQAANSAQDTPPRNVI